jgi:hypothetical protein
MSSARRVKKGAEAALHKFPYERQLTKDDVRELFRLLDWILDLPEELQEQFREDV